MQFSDTSTNQGLIQDITFLLGAGVDMNNYTLEHRTRNINSRQGLVWQVVFDSYGGWQFLTDGRYYYGTQNLTINTGTYSIPTTGLTIKYIEVLDSSGGWRRLLPLTFEEYTARGGSALIVNNAGTSIVGSPVYYYPIGSKVQLIPVPPATVANGLRIYYDEALIDFSTTDTTATPAFAAPFHRVLSIGAALDYALARGMSDKVKYLGEMWGEYLGRIAAFYERRYIDTEVENLQTPDPLQSYT